MVLQEASSEQSSDPYSDSLPDTPSSDLPAFPIDLSQYPRPAPFMRLHPTFSASKQTRDLTNLYSIIAKSIRRTPTPPEYEALTYYYLKAQSYSSYGIPLGAFAGVYRAYRTRTQGGLPFWPPPFAPKELREPPAWTLKPGLGQSARSGVYLVVGAVLGHMLLTSYGATTAVVGMRRDRRLGDVNERLMSRSQERATGLPQGPGQGRQSQVQAKEQSQQGVQSERWGDAADNASPMASGADMSDVDVRKGRAEQRQNERWGSGEPGGSRVERGTAADYDDASPTAGAPPQSSAPGSSWDRIRAEAAEGKPHQHQQPSQSNGAQPQQGGQSQSTGDLDDFFGDRTR